MRELADACWNALLELLPSRRKARFGDMDYDWEHSVDTTRSNVNFRAQLLAELTGRPYFATEPWLFEEMMHALPIKFQDFTFVDLGSGKGRTLLMAAPHGFKRIIGVEFMPEWHQVAKENIRKFAEAHPGSPAMESVCMDARDFEFPAGPLVVYLFNPFLESTFVNVLGKLRRSAEQSPRAVYAVYRFTEFEEVLAKCDWLARVEGTEQWVLYRNTFGARDQ